MRFVCLFWQNVLFPAIAWTLLCKVSASSYSLLFKSQALLTELLSARKARWVANVHRGFIGKVMPKYFYTFCLFQLFDMDEDGTITEDEFASIIQSALRLPELDVSALFKEIDADETGKLSYGKLHSFVRKNSLIVILTGGFPF